MNKFAITVALLLCLPVTARAQVTLVGTATATAVAHTVATTPAISTTGATALVAIIACNDALATMSDSYSNQWDLVSSSGIAVSGHSVNAFVCLAPTVGSSHTFSASASVASYPNLFVTAWSGVYGVGGGFSTVTTTTATTTTINAGSVYARTAGVFVSGVNAYLSASAPTIDSGYSCLSSAGLNNNWYTGGMGWLVVSSAQSQNPQWSFPSQSNIAALHFFLISNGSISVSGGATVTLSQGGTISSGTLALTGGTSQLTGGTAGTLASSYTIAGTSLAQGTTINIGGTVYSIPSTGFIGDITPADDGLAMLQNNLPNHRPRSRGTIAVEQALNDRRQGRTGVRR